VELHDAIPTELELLVSAFALDTEIAKSSRNVFDLGKRSFTIASADLLAATIRKRLADYKTTLSDDDDILQHLSNDSGIQVPFGVHPNRYRVAVSVRKGEKEILQQVLQLTQQFVTNSWNGKRKRVNDEGLLNEAHKTKT
jgi:hypothetical protein